MWALQEARAGLGGGERIGHDALKDSAGFAADARTTARPAPPLGGHNRCVRLAQVASKLSSDSEIVVASMDMSKNDIVGMEPEGFPTLLLYPKGAKHMPIEYDGSRDSFDLIAFVSEVRSGKSRTGGRLPDLEDYEESAKVEL